MSKRKLKLKEMMDETLNEVKQTHGHLISEVNEDEVGLIYVKGFSKFRQEVEAAKRI